MKKSSIILIVVGIIILSLAGWSVGKYNGMISKKLVVEQKWSDVEVQYQQRFDLIPNVQATVQGAADFEKSTFTAVTEARSAWARANSTPGRADDIAAINGFDSAISRLLVSVENYPQLKATEAFVSLITTLEGTENRIAQARRQYNEVVTDFNTYIKIFPNNIFAGFFNFATEALFESANEAATAPQINFNQQ